MRGRIDGKLKKLSLYRKYFIVLALHLNCWLGAVPKNIYLDKMKIRKKKIEKGKISSYYNNYYVGGGKEKEKEKERKQHFNKTNEKTHHEKLTVLLNAIKATLFLGFTDLRCSI